MQIWPFNRFPYSSFTNINLDWLLEKMKYTVQSVNGLTGTVILEADDVHALPDTYTPPVLSVNGKTGAVSLNAADVGALSASWVFVGTANGDNAQSISLENLTFTELLVVYTSSVSKSWFNSLIVPVQELSANRAIGGTVPTTGSLASYITDYSVDTNTLTPRAGTNIRVYRR